VPLICEQAVRLLNCFYDCVDWQLLAPLRATVATVGERFEVTALSRYVLAPGEAVLLVAACPNLSGGGKQRGEAHAVHEVAPEVVPEVLVTVRAARVEVGEDAAPGARGLAARRLFRVSADMGVFPQCGFYDWRFVVMAPGGKPRLLPGALPDDLLGRAGVALPTPQPAAAEPSVGARGFGPLDTPAGTAGFGRDPPPPPAPPLTQGRFIVQPSGLDCDKWHHSVIVSGRPCHSLGKKQPLPAS
jgi:hypothetical protein